MLANEWSSWRDDHSFAYIRRSTTSGEVGDDPRDGAFDRFARFVGVVQDVEAVAPVGHVDDFQPGRLGSDELLDGGRYGRVLQTHPREQDRQRARARHRSRAVPAGIVRPAGQRREKRIAGGDTAQPRGRILALDPGNKPDPAGTWGGTVGILRAGREGENEIRAEWVQRIAVSELNATLDLPLGPTAPSAARKAIRLMLVVWQLTDPAWLDDAEVIVGELVTNAYRHGGGLLQLSMEAHADQVMVRVADGSSVVPRPHEPGTGGGFGLRLIEAFAEDWGVQPFQGGKQVWVRLRRYPGQRQREA
jgi:anti-sigma regulatory factor (Ser/Thr protein kinase)